MSRQIATSEFLERGLDAPEIPNLVWAAPSGDIVGVFFRDEFYETKDAFVESIGQENISIINTFPEFPIGSGKYILRYLQIILGDSITPQQMGRMIGNATDWSIN